MASNSLSVTIDRSESNFPFTQLPEEIQLRVLLNLGATDISHFREVSKSFSELASATAVEYKVQLDIAGMVDNPHNGSSLIERLRKLRKYRDGWRTALLSIDPNVPASDDVAMPGLYWEWVGGVFPSVINSHPSQKTLHLYRPGSSLRELKTKEWTAELHMVPDGYRMLGCGTDMAQDLLVLSLAPQHYNPENDEVYILQLLSLRRTGQPHPLASSHALLGQPLRTNGPQAPRVQICGDVVAYAVYNDHWVIEVWNWKSGTLLLRHQSHLFDGFALLNQSYLLTLAFDRHGSDGLLAVYCIYPSDPALNSGAKIRRAGDPDLTLKTMPFVKGARPRAWLSHSKEASSPDDIPPFQYDPDLSILTLHFRVGYYSDDPEGRSMGAKYFQFLLVVSVPELIRNLDRLRSSASAPEPSAVGPPSLEWDEWGPSSTRLVIYKSHFRGTVPATSRTRCAFVVRSMNRHDPFEYILVLSAHPHSALAGRTTDRELDDALGDVPGLIVYNDNIAHPNVFQTYVHTTLPINVLCRRIMKREGEEVEIGLFEDGLSVTYMGQGLDFVLGETLMFCV
ncbi:hypothetical protein V8D89_011606 [Ganoderma adspersum]